MRRLHLVLAACAAIGCASCGLSYQQRQDRFRERYLTGCQVVRSASAADVKLQSTEQLAEISHAISVSKEEIDRCSLEARELWANLEGLVAIKLTVNADGSVSDPALLMYHSTISEAAVGCCLVHVAETWKLPAPRDGKPLVVEHLFDLEPDIFKIKFRPSSDVGKPQPASGTEIHRTW